MSAAAKLIKDKADSIIEKAERNHKKATERANKELKDSRVEFNSLMHAVGLVCTHDQGTLEVKRTEHSGTHGRDRDEYLDTQCKLCGLRLGRKHIG
jgi:hypothetical protein